MLLMLLLVVKAISENCTVLAGCDCGSTLVCRLDTDVDIMCMCGNVCIVGGVRLLKLSLVSESVIVFNMLLYNVTSGTSSDADVTKPSLDTFPAAVADVSSVCDVTDANGEPSVRAACVLVNELER